VVYNFRKSVVLSFPQLLEFEGSQVAALNLHCQRKVNNLQICNFINNYFWLLCYWNPGEVLRHSLNLCENGAFFHERYDY
jgi:hypothetical protein